jgi:hypothetical protein
VKFAVLKPGGRPVKEFSADLVKLSGGETKYRLVLKKVHSVKDAIHYYRT